MWKDIKDYEGLYQVSDDGKVRRFLKNGNIKELKNRNGLYLSVSLSKNGIKKSVNVHRLVAETYLGIPEGRYEVNHKDGNRHNNNLSNLEWLTQSENNYHAKNVIKHYPWGKPPRAVRSIDLNTGEIVKEYSSVSEAAKFYGKASSRQTITLACQGYSTAYGYKWEYVE